MKGAARVAVAMLCKPPLPGRCKTRLCPPLSPIEAARLSAAFIADVAAMVADVVAGDRGAAAFVLHAPEGPAEALAPLVPASFSRRVQQGVDLGERLANAAEGLLAEGFDGVCLIGADSPTLPPSLLRRALAALRHEGERIVIAPAIDGGYVLIGLKRPCPSLFAGIRWSTASVLTETLLHAALAGVPVRLLPAWYDVDDEGALLLLRQELFGAGIALARPGVNGATAPHTRACLERLRGLGRLPW